MSAPVNYNVGISQNRIFLLTREEGCADLVVLPIRKVVEGKTVTLVCNKETAWEVAGKLLTRPGDMLIQVGEKWVGKLPNIKLSGSRVYDSSGYHIIGSVIARLRDDGSVNYTETFINPD